ncbi:MAG: 23S rRNA (guanosine(2251)-2'-O)-methyltransferase RlmB [Candidatus Omnitrophica bacterium]|nr:23S rRNA (guanosine(2251)-2'-O)-methyltransferase RlmB [Candidatus Omnitrophota bacterium]MCB9747642.1 23S rRNA (guanosine(2251)-2'-O)-methyltransferase RlmB [Candidatus Omnitrophota bacterium]
MRIFGSNSVIERLRSNPQSIHKIFLQEGYAQSAYIRKKAQQWKLPVIVYPRTKMQKMSQGANTQGIMIQVDDFEYMHFDDVLDLVKKKKYSIIFLDELNDPQNLGAIIRSAACFGRFAIVLPSHKSVSITEAVLRVASGGDNHVPVAQVSNINKAIKQAKELGIHIAGAVTENGENLMEVKLPFPLALVLGSEQKGIRDIIRKELDLALTIPMFLERLSFNVANAASIFAYEITRQKSKKSK